MKIQRDLKYATFIYDDEDKSITIETRSDAPIPPKGHVETDEQYAERIEDLNAVSVVTKLHLLRV